MKIPAEVSIYRDERADEETHGRQVRHWTELDGLRGVLSFGVVLFHFGFNSFALRAVGWHGVAFALAVDVFFILSGFVLSHSVRHGVKKRTFILKRSLRLAPVFVVTTICAAIAANKFPSALELAMAAPIAGLQPINFPAWSVCWEYYLPIAAVLVAPKLPDKVVLPALAISLVVLGVADVVVVRGGELMLLRAAVGLACGGLLYRADIPGRGNFLVACAALAGAMVLAGSVALFAFVVPFAAASCILRGRYSKTVFSSSLFKLAGDLSYTMYLAHIPVLLVMARFWNVDANPIAKLAGIFVTIMAAYVLTVTVERPFMKISKWAVSRVRP